MESGVKGLFRGWDAIALRTGMGSAVQLATYESCKSFVENTGFFPKGSSLTHFFSAVLGSIFVVISMNPLDLVATRIYNQPSKDGKGILYNGMMDAIFKIWKTEGPTAFYKGLSSHYSRLAPQTVFVLVFFEVLKKNFSN